MTGRLHTWLMLTAAVALIVPALSGSHEALAAGDVRVQVTQIKASNAGDEAVDPALGDLGERLKRKYRYRNFKLVGSNSQSVAQGGSASYSLANGMTLTVKVTSVEGKNIGLTLTVSKGAAVVTSFSVRSRNRATFLANVPWGQDVLILAIRPTLGR